MRNLNEILNEGIFDKNIAGREDDLIRGWLDRYNIKPTNISEASIEVDEKSKKDFETQNRLIVCNI